MLKVSNHMSSSMNLNLNSCLKLIVILGFAMVVTGCVSAKSNSTELAQPAVAPISLPVPAPLNQWSVVAGNHLWGIAGVWEVFNVPEKWPLLYKANLSQIKDADLIYPGQVLEIPRDSSIDEVNAAIHHAKTRGAWSLGPVEASDTQYLKNSP